MVENEVVKNKKFRTLKTKLKNLLKKIPDETLFIPINQYNKYKKENSEKKNWRCWQVVY